jgi:predicted Zn-dependent protease
VALIETLERLLASGQDNALLRYGLASEYLKAGRFDNAADQLRRAVAHDPTYSAAWKLLGQALAAAGRTGEAIQAYENGIGAAEAKGDLQAAKEMKVFLKRLLKP